MKGRPVGLLLGLTAALLLSACAGQSAPPPEGGESPAPATAELTPEPASGPGLRISELMIKNKASVCLEGSFPDWVELENRSGEPVELSGWALSDREGKPKLYLSAGSLGPGELALLPLDGRAFSLSEGESLYLFDPEGRERDRALCAGAADLSLQRQEDGGFTESAWISPGQPNGAAGYEAYCQRRETPALSINEVMVSNFRHPAAADRLCDWVELKNNSDQPIAMEDYSLTDDLSQPERWRFNEESLAPGGLLTICCDEEAAPSPGNTGFALGAAGEQLYLLDKDGRLVDWVYLHDIPLEGSMGRQSGRAGFVYFEEPSPGADNGQGCRFISQPPRLLTADGCFESVDSLQVELEGSGELYYTLDGSLPTRASPRYTGPVTLTETGVLRAVAIQEDAAASAAVTGNFILNEGHSLPVLCLTANEPTAFMGAYFAPARNAVFDANLALYEGREQVFQRDCEAGLRGKTSLELPKKSLGVRFKSRHGGMLSCDLFGMEVTEFSSLAIRAGQDYTTSVFRNELCQELCREGSRAALTQASRWCVLYLNGCYWGVYSLKEDLSRQFYASHMGVSKDSVEVNQLPASKDSPFYALADAGWYQDMREEESYRRVLAQIDVDSFIDWLLFECYCANTDTQGNARLYRSTENGNRWSLCFYDLDWSFGWPGGSFFGYYNEYNHVGADLAPLLRKLSKNPEFRDRLCRRYAELTQGVLSNEHVLDKINENAALLEPEMARERERWNLSLEDWYGQVELLRQYISGSTNAGDWAGTTIDQLCQALELSEAERRQYFGE